VLEDAVVDKLFQEMYDAEGYELSVDLEAKTVITPSGESFAFDLDDFRRHCLLNGLDDIELTLQDSDSIQSYEESRRQSAPWLFDAI